MGEVLMGLDDEVGQPPAYGVDDHVSELAARSIGASIVSPSSIRLTIR
jgi:hypothetical protein